MQYKTFISVMALLLLINVGISAQTGSSNISGTVTDGQGNVIAGANVTLISEQNRRLTTTTGESGNFTFNSIQPGNYSVEVEAQGFKKSAVASFQALVDKTNDIKIQLEVGNISEVVTVSTGGIENVVNTQDASLGNNFVAEQIEKLPLQGRNVGNLLSLQTAVTPSGAVAGGRQDQANFTLDGVDVNDQQTGLNLDQTEAFTAVLRVNPDSVDEFRVTTSNPDASKGRSSGAQVSFITKSGTNNFRGALYEYHRNTATTANDFFNNAAGRYVATDRAVIDGLAKVGDLRAPRPKLIRNLFGGRLGGPIIKDRLFFFYNYEGMREAKETPVTQIVPLASLGQGIIKFRDNLGNPVELSSAQINALTSGGLAVADVNPAALAVLADAARRYPANDFSVGDRLNTGGFRFNASTPVKQNTHTARFDWLVTSDQKHQISLRANYQQDSIGGVRAFPDTPVPTLWSHPLGIAVTHTWLVNSSMTNRFSYGLTRLAYSQQGDSSDNDISFRDVFAPSNFDRTFSRINPTHNFTNDFTWLKGNHTIQFGTNIRLVRNKRDSLAKSFDVGQTNFSAYEGSGGVLLTPLNEYLRRISGDSTRSVNTGSRRSAQSALTAVFGRLSEYSANFNYGIDLQPLQSGVPVVREFATEEYDFYAQDVWKIRPNMTLTAGLRYGLSRPVYETQGYQVAPDIPLQEYFRRRVEASARGENYTDPLTLSLVGPKNNGPDFYSWDKNNFQPRVALAWSPDFKQGFLAKLFGNNQESVFRGGFAITNDYFGQQLAVSFDNNNTLGFSSTVESALNAYNITTRLAPLYTGSGMTIRNLPGINSPATLTFPRQQPLDDTRRVENSLDSNLVSPINYSWNVSYGRKLPMKMYIDVSYIGRLARNLLATRDIMAPNNLKDPKSGQTYYEAATALEKQLRAGATRAQIQAQPFFENMYPTGDLDFFGLGGSNSQGIFDLFQRGFVGSNDWTTTQDLLDRFSSRQLYYNRQYGALSAFGTIASSDYHGMAVSVRQRFKGLTWDLNYTFSKSIDDASGLQTSTSFSTNGAFILNSLRQEDNRAVSNFDIRHIINFNSVWDIPIGRSRQFFNGMNKFTDAVFGGWQLSSIARFNTGVPIPGFFFDDSGWATNWQIKGGGFPTKPIQTGQNMTSGTGGTPNLFANPQAAYNSFRSPFPGETGLRNAFRYPSFYVLDLGLAKSFGMPWGENQRLTFRWDVFNVTNTARLTGPLSNRSLGYQPDKSNAPENWGNFTSQQGSPRIMQFALRYDF